MVPSKNFASTNVPLWDPNPMNRLRSKVDSACPIILARDWATEKERGWRWACNVSVTDSTGAEMLKDCQRVHGASNVTIGQPFDENEMKPIPIPTLCGLYVRDVEETVEALRRDLDNDKKVAKWLTEAT
jgi:hypothetical protein